MRTIPNLALTRAQINKLLETPFAIGGESVLCYTDQDSLLKLFINRDNIPNYEQTGKFQAVDLCGMSDNKLQKVAHLYQLQLEDSVQPLSTITMDGQLLGYEITWDKADFMYQSTAQTRKTNVDVLRQTQGILEYYASKDITYGDVFERNILLNARTGKAKFCDIDNMRVGEYPIDIMDPELLEYGEIRGYDETADAYMHNLLTIYALTAVDSYEDIITGLNMGTIPKGFKLRANKTIRSMATPETFDGKYLTKYIKR